MSNEFLDHLGRPVVAVTGLGIVSSLGRGKAENWKALTSGTSGIHDINRFPTEGLKTTIAGTVDFMDIDPMNAPALSFALAESAGEEAISQAGLDVKNFGGPLFLAAPPVELEWQHKFDMCRDHLDLSTTGYERLLEIARANADKSLYEISMFGTTADRLSERFGTTGLPISLSTACASGATAIQMGVEAIRRGEANLALCSGTDGSVHIESLIRFSLLSALTTQNDPAGGASKPFSKDRDGFVMAEGAGTLVLESLEHAVNRGAEVLGIVKGCGEKADHFHRTRSSPDGSPVIAAVERGLADAGVGLDGIDYINAHGTSTPENDRMEYNSLKDVFGERIHKIPISSNKSMIGHALTAAGALEAVFSLLTIREGLIPPTINHNNPDPDIHLDVVPNTAREAKVSAVLSNSFGFGGQNACLVFAEA